MICLRVWTIYPQGKTCLQARVQVISLTISVLAINNITTMHLLTQQKVDIAPDYLLQLSKQVDALSKLALIDRQAPLTQEFSRVLQTEFTELSQYLALYADDSTMKDSVLLKCKLSLEFYVWERANSLLASTGGRELSEIMGYLIGQVHEQVAGLEELIHRERMGKAEVLDGEKEKLIGGLRRDLGVKREYMLDLQQRIREVEDQNSKLYSKMIAGAKQKILSRSFNPAQPSRSTNHDKASPRKKILARSYEDEINEILESKWKIEGLNDKRVSLSDYLRTYFTMKYGKPLAEQNEAGFRESISLLAHNQEKHVFLLFQAVLDEECDEAYFQEERQFTERVIKCIKRYVSERYNRPLHELDRMFQGCRLEDKHDFYLTEPDVETLLTNIYKSGEVRTLQMILNELASSRGNDPNSNKLSCGRLINQLLDYELNKHLMRVEDIVREIGRLPDRVDRLVNLQQLQRVALRVVRDKDRCEVLLREEQERRWTVSEAIELIERVRHMRFRKERGQFILYGAD